MNNEELDYINIMKAYIGTCSINNLKTNHITFARNYEITKKLSHYLHPLCLIAPDNITTMDLRHIPDNVEIYFSNNVDYSFTVIHNIFARKHPNTKIFIPQSYKIHPTVILDVEGIKVAIGPNNEKLQFIHTGGVDISDDVEIGAYTVVHKASMDMTIIKKGVRIGAHCNIGHNNIIGENTVLAAGVMTSGSVTIGKNCWFGTGSLIRNGISICDDVVIGIGSVVIKDITEPGIYVGNPAKFLKEKSDDWNF